jgi:hypothetical protein
VWVELVRAVSGPSARQCVRTCISSGINAPDVLLVS